MQINSKWKKATIHLECATDSVHYTTRIARMREQSKLLEEGKISPEEYAPELLSGFRDVRYHGTAIFFVHNSRHYLLTARHVVFDNSTQNDHVQNEEVKNYSNSIKNYVKLSGSEKIYNIIFKVPSLDDVISGLNIQSFLMNLGAGVSSFAPYTFSDPEDDLAIISLDQRDERFAAELIKSGYEPITIADISDGPRSEGDEIYAIGFPSATAIVGQSHKDAALENWSSSYYSLPIFAFGRVAMLHDSLSFFWADISVYPGNSGGPVISGDQLVGIVSGQATEEIDGVVDEVRIRIPFAKVIKTKLIHQLLKVQEQKDAMRY